MGPRSWLGRRGACDRILAPKRGGQALAHGHQHVVAELMSMRVIDRLEVIEVQGQDARHPSLAHLTTQCLIEALQEQLAVGEAGERVGDGRLFDRGDHPVVLAQADRQTEHDERKRYRAQHVLGGRGP